HHCPQPCAHRTCAASKSPTTQLGPINSYEWSFPGCDSLGRTTYRTALRELPRFLCAALLACYHSIRSCAFGLVEIRREPDQTKRVSNDDLALLPPGVS